MLKYYTHVEQNSSVIHMGDHALLLQEEFIDNPALGFADAGIIFVIHSPRKVPQFDGLGLSSPVGTHARVTIRQVKVSTRQAWSE